jgi:hypothetical protein
MTESTTQVVGRTWVRYAAMALVALMLAALLSLSSAESASAHTVCDWFWDDYYGWYYDCYYDNSDEVAALQAALNTTYYYYYDPYSSSWQMGMTSGANGAGYAYGFNY